MNEPDTTADTIQALCTAIQHIDPDTVDRDRVIADAANAIIHYAERLGAARDAMVQRVERLRAYSDGLAWWLTLDTIEEVMEEHLQPGDLGDETEEDG